MKYKTILFDMDGTLTESRGEIAQEHLKVFERLCAAFTVAVISGADVGQMHAQVPFNDLWKRGTEDLYLMALNGNVCVHNGTEKWRTSLFWRDRMEILAHIAALRAEFPCDVTDERDLVEDRAAQVSFSFIGHHAPREKKAEFVGMGIDFPGQKERNFETPINQGFGQVFAGHPQTTTIKRWKLPAEH